MLNNMAVSSSLKALARKKAQQFVMQTVDPLLVDKFIEQGWDVERRLKRSVRMKRMKSHGILLEDRVWSLLYRMGFCYLPAEGGATIQINPTDPSSPITKLDGAAIDSEVGIAIECKSSSSLAKRTSFQEELGKFVKVRHPFTTAVRKQFNSSSKRQIGLAMFMSNSILSENDLLRANNDKVTVFNEQDLAYYEELVNQLGPSAKYQFLADLFPGKPIPGLAIRVPAIRAKTGGDTTYTFSMPPEYLLKIAYVSHRSKGKGSDIETYQRMVRRSRLKSIREYIDEDGVFPTNIVLNLNTRPTFERRTQDGNSDAGTMGWLEIRPAYKSAWIIDGQHRLFAYSGHPRASSDHLSVLAFEKLSAAKQSQYFIDINAKQKTVKQSLLRELSAELHWDSSDLQARVGAIVAKSILVLDADRSSPFYHRIQTSDDKKTDLRCISFASIDSALQKPDMFIQSTRRRGVLDYGPLWAGEDGQATLRRTVYIVNQWFDIIRSANSAWWNLGSAPGGGLAMNNGVTVCINVLRSVFQHVQSSDRRLGELANDDLWERIEEYAVALTDHLATLNNEQRKHFRDRQGIGGQAYNTKLCQAGVKERIDSFEPEGLAEFIATREAETNTTAKALVDQIETNVQGKVIGVLKDHFGPDEAGWWINGVPKSVRVDVGKRFEEADGKYGKRENYFNFIEYRKIILENWVLFADIFGNGKPTLSKDKRTQWMQDVNEIRNVVSHVSAGLVSFEQLERLREHHTWLMAQFLADGV